MSNVIARLSFIQHKKLEKLRRKQRLLDNEVAVSKKVFDDCHKLLNTQRTCLDDEYMQGMYNGMELILYIFENDRDPIFVSKLGENKERE